MPTKITPQFVSRVLAAAGFERSKKYARFSFSTGFQAVRYGFAHVAVTWHDNQAIGDDLRRRVEANLLAMAAVLAPRFRATRDGPVLLVEAPEEPATSHSEDHR